GPRPHPRDAARRARQGRPGGARVRPVRRARAARRPGRAYRKGVRLHPGDHGDRPVHGSRRPGDGTPGVPERAQGVRDRGQRVGPPGEGRDRTAPQGAPERCHDPHTGPRILAEPDREDDYLEPSRGCPQRPRRSLERFGGRFVDMVICRFIQYVGEVEEPCECGVSRCPGPGSSRGLSWAMTTSPVGPAEGWLAYLTNIERSPNTVKAYAHDLKDFLVFLARRDTDWREVRLEDLGEYVAWLALPPAGRNGAVAVLPSVEPHVGAATVNRKLAALAAFYAYQARNGADVGELLTTWQAGGRRNGGFKQFLHHVSSGRPQARRTIALKVPKKLPRVVTAAEMQAILDACEHLRDRLLLAILWDAGVRVGE